MNENTIKKIGTILWNSIKVFFNIIWIILKSLFKVVVVIAGIFVAILKYSEKQEKKTSKVNNSKNTISQAPKRGIKARIRLKGVGHEVEEIIPVTSIEIARKIIKTKYGNDAHISTMYGVEI